MNTEVIKRYQDSMVVWQSWWVLDNNRIIIGDNPFTAASPAFIKIHTSSSPAAGTVDLGWDKQPDIAIPECLLRR